MQTRRSAVRRLLHMLVLCGLTLGMVACSGHYPADPDGTLDRVSGGVLRVGVSHQPPWVVTSDGGEADPEGVEVDLIEEYAATLDAEIEWHAGGEEHLVSRLAEQELDMVIGGLTDASPWESDAALTTSYVESVGVDGSTNKHVMAVQMGENAFMTSLERFLLEQDVDQQLPQELRP